MSRTWGCTGDYCETIRVRNMPHLFLHVFEYPTDWMIVVESVDHLHTFKSLFSDDHLPLSPFVSH